MNIDRIRRRVDEIHEETFQSDHEQELRLQEEVARLERLILCVPESRRSQFIESMRMWQWGVTTVYGSKNKVFDDYIFAGLYHGWTPTPIPLEIIDAAIEHPFLGLRSHCQSCGMLLPVAGGFVLNDEKGTFRQTIYVFPFWPCPVCGGEPGDTKGNPIDWLAHSCFELPLDPPFRFVTELPDQLCKAAPLRM
jgi:hypothetical protein